MSRLEQSSDNKSPEDNDLEHHIDTSRFSIMRRIARIAGIAVVVIIASTIVPGITFETGKAYADGICYVIDFQTGECRDPGEPGTPAVPSPGDAKKCGDFADWPSAQSWFERYRPLYGEVVAFLDADNDGEACEANSGAPVTTPVPLSGQGGYWMLSSNGTVYGYGDARPITPKVSVQRATAMAAAGSTGGYYVLSADGTVFARGAVDFGSVPAGSLRQGEIASAISVRPQGDGYWVFTDRGRVFAFGAAGRAVTLGGDLSNATLNGPIVASVAAASGSGYWMVGSDGGVFAFDVPFYGSMGGQKLNRPVNGIAPDPDGVGYWLVASDGGIFAFGAPFRGSMGGTVLNAPVVGALAYGDGYLMVGADGGIFNFSTKPFLGSLGAQPPLAPITGVAVRPG